MKWRKYVIGLMLLVAFVPVAIEALWWAFMVFTPFVGAVDWSPTYLFAEIVVHDVAAWFLLEKLYGLKGDAQ